MSHTPFSAAHLAAVHQILDLGAQQQRALYVVGGMVRDLLRGASLIDPDLDIVVEGNALEFATHIHPTIGGSLKRFPDFFTAKIIDPFGGSAFSELDFASTRTEAYPHPGALPVVSLASLADDLKRRDFTINAMAVSLADFIGYVSGEITRESIPVVDLYGGHADLQAQLVRVLHPKSFLDDPTRLFRACRYVGRLGGSLEQATAQRFAEALHGGAIGTISRFRVATEIKKIFFDDAAPAALTVADSVGLLRASEIVSPSRYPAVVRALITPPRAVSAGSEDEKLRYLLAVLLAGEGGAFVQNFGLAKKVLREIQSAVEQWGQSPIGELTAPQLVIKGVICPAAADEVANALHNLGERTP